MEKFHDSAFEDIVLLLVRAAHRALDLPTERFPLLARGTAGGVVEGRGGGHGPRLGVCVHAIKSIIMSIAYSLISKMLSISSLLKTMNDIPNECLLFKFHSDYSMRR